MMVDEAGKRWFLAYPLIEWDNVAIAMGNDHEAEQHYRAGEAAQLFRLGV